MLLYNEIIQWTSHDKDIHVNRWILKKNNLSFVGSIWWRLTSNLDFSSKYTFIDLIVCKYLSSNS